MSGDRWQCVMDFMRVYVMWGAWVCNDAAGFAFDSELAAVPISVGCRDSVLTKRLKCMTELACFRSWRMKMIIAKP